MIHYILLISFLIFGISAQKTDSMDCEVCINYLTGFVKTLTNDDTAKEITDKLVKFCARADGPESRFCYYIGALEESPTKIIFEVSKPLSYGMPPEKICKKLRQMDSQICDIRYPKPINFAREHLMTLKIKDLKNILIRLNAHCEACFEKIDFVNMVESLKPANKKEDL